MRDNSRLLLQSIVAIGALVPILAGLMGVVLGPAMIQTATASSVDIDSHYRYLSGLLLGIGLGFWSCIPAIETKTHRVQILAAIVFIGGLGRLASLVTYGTPDKVMLFALVMELVVTPLLALWQYYVRQR